MGRALGQGRLPRPRARSPPEKAAGPGRLLDGLAFAGRQPGREGATVSRGGREIGVVTSGNFSPTLGHGIAFAFLPPDMRTRRRGRGRRAGQAGAGHGRADALLPAPVTRPGDATDRPTCRRSSRWCASSPTYEREPDAVVLEPDEFATHVFGTDAVARALIAEAPDGRVAGFAIWFRTFSTWLGTSGIWLEDLFVRPEYRRFGLGRALLDELRTRTTGRVEWAVLDWNEPAHAFYRSLGAAPAGRLDHLALATTPRGATTPLSRV